MVIFGVLEVIFGILLAAKRQFFLRVFFGVNRREAAVFFASFVCGKSPRSGEFFLRLYLKKNTGGGGLGGWGLGGYVG